MTVRQWSDQCFAGYVGDDGTIFGGRFVGTETTRDLAEALAAQAEKRNEQVYDGDGPAGLPSTAGPDRITLTEQEERL